MCGGSTPSAPPPAPPPPPPAAPVEEVSIQNNAEDLKAKNKRKQVGVSKLQVPLNKNIGGPSGLGVPV